MFLVLSSGWSRIYIFKDHCVELTRDRAMPLRGNYDPFHLYHFQSLLYTIKPLIYTNIPNNEATAKSGVPVKKQKIANPPNTAMPA